MKVTAELDGIQQKDGMEIYIKRKSLVNLPPYDCIGGNMSYDTRVPGFQNLYKVLKSLSKQALWVWFDLVEHRNRCTNIAVYKTSNSTEERRLIPAYKALVKADLVLRVKRQHYLLNPLSVFPEREYFQQVSDLWLALKESNKG